MDDLAGWLLSPGSWVTLSLCYPHSTCSVRSASACGWTGSAPAHSAARLPWIPCVAGRMGPRLHTCRCTKLNTSVWGDRQGGPSTAEPSPGDVWETASRTFSCLSTLYLMTPGSPHQHILTSLVQYVHPPPPERGTLLTQTWLPHR